MRIAFKKIPQIALYFYMLGFVIILGAYLNKFFDFMLMSEVVLQQLFIAGAIIVLIGSFINVTFQFKKE